MTPEQLYAFIDRLLSIKADHPVHDLYDTGYRDAMTDVREYVERIQALPCECGRCASCADFLERMTEKYPAVPA